MPSSRHLFDQATQALQSVCDAGEARNIAFLLLKTKFGLGRAAVLAQLKRSWDASATMDVQAWQEQAQRLGDLRASLNNYIERLNHRQPNGFSAFESIGPAGPRFRRGGSGSFFGPIFNRTRRFASSNVSLPIFSAESARVHSSPVERLVSCSGAT